MTHHALMFSAHKRFGAPYGQSACPVPQRSPIELHTAAPGAHLTLSFLQQ